MARRILNRKDLRANFEAAERHKGEDEDELEEGAEAEAGDGDAEVEPDEVVTAEADHEDDEEERPKKKKPAKEPKPRSRSRAAKTARLKVVWGVFNNSNQRVAVFNYPQRQEAEELAAKLRADKKSTHFVQAVKEPMDEKTEAK